MDGLGLSEVPQLDRMVPRAAEQSLIGGIKMETANLLGVALKSVDALLCSSVPHLVTESPISNLQVGLQVKWDAYLDGVILGPGDDVLLIEAKAHNLVNVTFDNVRAFLRFQVPHAHCVVCRAAYLSERGEREEKG
jgi:hypothetical protein